MNENGKMIFTEHYYGYSVTEQNIREVETRMTNTVNIFKNNFFNHYEDEVFISHELKNEVIITDPRWKDDPGLVFY